MASIAQRDGVVLISNWSARKSSSQRGDKSDARMSDRELNTSARLEASVCCDNDVCARVLKEDGIRHKLSWLWTSYATHLLVRVTDESW